MATLRLTRLVMEGFKSFAGRVELPFPGSLIAIVGPNGAGKSNISDAIAWVLGEQSARLLRSQSMAEVIFAGSPNRPPLGAAEVAITISSSDGRWASTGGVLEVSRRVFRDGTSEYRLHGRKVRLKDVMDALFDAGLGTRAYAVIEQGRIGQVLSLRANERRALFEEAAGITRFRARRHEAELRLAETRANLVRIVDVSNEIRRSLEAVRKQARQTERYFELRDQLVATRSALLAGRRQAASRRLEERERAVAEATEQEAAEAARLAEAGARLEQARGVLDRCHEALAAARREEAEAQAAAVRCEAEEAAARREVEDALASVARAATEIASMEAQRRELEVRAETLTGALATTRSQLEAAQAASDAAQAAAAAAAAEATRVVAGAEEQRRHLLQALAVASEARAQVHRLEVEHEQSRFQLRRLQAEAARLRTHLGTLGTSEEEAARQSAEAEAALHAAEAAQEETRRRHAQLKAQRAEVARLRDAAAHARWQARHEREALERQLQTARTLPQALARVLRQEAVIGTVADFLDPPPELAPLFDRAFGELLSLPVLADEETLQHLFAALDRLEGRVEAVVADRSLPARPSPLLAAARVAERDLPWLSRALPRAATAESAAHAATLAAEDPDLVLVLPERGRRRGTRVTLAGGPSAGAGLLELRARHREALAAEQQTGVEEENLTAQLATLAERLETLEAELGQREEEGRRAAAAAAAARSLCEARHRERQRLERELEALGAEETRLTQELEALATRLHAAQEEAERLAQRVEEMERTAEELGQQAEAARGAAAAATAAAERAHSVVAVTRERLAAAERERAGCAREAAALAARLAAAVAEREAQQQRVEQARATVAARRADLALLLAAHRQASQRVAALTEEEAVTRARVEAESEKEEAQRRQHQAAQDALYAARLAVAEARAEVARIEQTAALVLPQGATPDATPPSEEELPAWEERERELAAQLAEVGPVNELALAERQALEERYAFLRTQRRDLERALESLAATIKELDDTCSARFLATLEEASRSFAEVFRTLFAGGDAYLELADPESPLESGIEVRVRPPGKHTQSVLLLSGGEKALAAIALLLALFRIRPAPFCVLDEVDAALDDSNVERLCRLLREMSAATQFILITHNRRTMAHADVLYGVTMAEPGVSRIVSVRLEE